MSKVQMLRALVKQRLSLAAEEIFGAFERTIAEYEEELCRSKEENERHRKLLDAVLNPQLRLHRAALPSDVHKVTAGDDEQQEKSSSLDQEDPPELPHIKEEQEELWTNQEGGQLQDITEFRFTPVPVKSEEDEEKPQSSQLHQTQTEEMKTEDDGEDCGGPEPDRNFNLDAHSTPDTDDFPEPDTDDSDDWKETRDPQTSFNSVKNNINLNDVRCRSDEKPFSCSVCDKRFTWSFERKRHKCVGESLQLGELWTNQEGEQLQDKTKFTPVPVKSEEDDDEEKPQSSQLHQRPTEEMETEDDGEDCGGPEPDRNSDPERHLTPDADDKTEDCSEPGADRWKKKKEPQSGLNSQKNNEVPKHDARCKTGKKPFKCSVCGKGFSLRRSLNYHMAVHTGEMPFSCSVCNKGFSQSSCLKSHMRTHTGEKPFSCSVCNKCFSHYTTLKSHIRTHTGEKPYICSVCNKCFAQSSCLKRHMRIHTGEKPYRCSVCNKCFSRDSLLKAHMITRHEDEDDDEEEPQHSQSHQRPIEEIKTEDDGEDCGGPQPTRNSDPERHLTSHADENNKISVRDVRAKRDKRPFKCSVCGKGFIMKGHLNRHIAVHTGEKPYSCSVCNKCFSRDSDVKLHMRTHTGEKPFSCSVCNKCFSHNLTLKSHMRTHTGEKPYSCSVCNKGFSQNTSLKSHMRTHTGEKPYSCSVCNKCFAHSTVLKYHMTTHTGEKPFSCSVCGKKFMTSHQLQIHKCAAS